MQIDLSNQHVQVTGSTAGIGQAITMGLSEIGARVSVIGRDQYRVVSTINSINRATGRDDATPGNHYSPA